MKVLHVIWSIDPRNGGPPVALVGMAKAQAQLGLEVSIITTWKRGENLAAIEQLKDYQVQVEPVGPCSGPLVRHPKLSDTIKKMVSAADIVHIHGLWEEINHQAAQSAQRLGRPYLVRPCGMLDPWSLGQSRLKKQLYMRWRLNQNLDHARAIHYTSRSEADRSLPLQIKAPVIIEPNGLDLEEFAQLPPPGTFRAKYPGLGQRPMLLFMSRLHRKKGLDLLIPAFAKANSGDAILTVAGPDEDGYRAEVEALVTRYNISGKVLFCGALHGPDRVAALADADLFVLPSYQENFGIVVVEALAANTPVIISDQVNICNQIKDSKVGAVVSLNIDALSNEITHWINDGELRQVAASGARAMVWAQYDWQQIAQRWIKHYTLLVAPVATSTSL
ncbi:MAG: glycosyltransferase [Abitibacteriaceae bacterium]|nr:glycosyltransferase [Abditibacteriaceae bacterium]